VWLIRAVVYLHAVPHVQLFARAGNGWLCKALRTQSFIHPERAGTCLPFHHLKLPFHHLKLSLYYMAMPFHHNNIFGQLIFGKIITNVAVRSQILRLKFTKFYFGPSPRWGSLQHSPGSLARFEGPTSKRREGR